MLTRRTYTHLKPVRDASPALALPFVVMITTTHIVTNALVALRKSGGAAEVGESSAAKWFVAGGLAPDIGLYALSAGAAVFFPLTRGMSFQESMEYAFSDLFFNDPAWVAIHNTFHSPVVLAALAAAGKLSGKDGLVAFAAGCFVHTAMDIPVHHNDGPLVFFPLDWETRFDSPVSYYDRDHYGGFVAPIDFAITILGGAAVARSWWKSRK